MTTALGSFEVTGGSEDMIEDLDGGLRLTHASGTQRFTGGIDGKGSVDWLMTYRSDRTAQFVGVQRIVGSIGGRRGSLVIVAQGDHDGTGSRIAWTVVDGSGTGELTGIRGSGAMHAPGGRTGSYELAYELDT